MKDFDTWFYVIAFVFYIVAQIMRGYKKAKNAKPQPQKPRQPETMRERVPGPTPTATKPQPAPKKRSKRFSFDDLLKEFEESFEGKPYPEPESKPVPKPQPGKNVVIETGFKGYSDTEFEESDYDDRAKVLQPVGKAEKRPPAEKQDPGSRDFTRSEGYKIEEKIENPYARMLKEPEGLKKAIVLSEILNRKYF